MSNKSIFAILLTVISINQIHSKKCYDFDEYGENLGFHDVKFWCQAKDVKDKKPNVAHSCDCDGVPLSRPCRRFCEEYKKLVLIN